MIKAINPAAIYLIALAVQVETVSAKLAASVATVCIGVIVTVYGSLHFTALGVGCQILSVVIDSCRMVWTQRLMQSKGSSLEPLNIMSDIAPSAAIVLWMCVSCFEFSGLVVDFRFFRHAPWLLGSALLAFALNLTTLTYVSKTSALTLSVTGVIKDIFLITVAAFAFDTSVAAMQMLGYAIALCGAFMYNHAKTQ